jgi:3D (Asp-Asp-Asp) domain-containing protein
MEGQKMRFAGGRSRNIALTTFSLVALLAFATTERSRSAPGQPSRNPATIEAGVTADFEITAYCVKGRTASGVKVRTGIAAADPKVLPVGSVVQVDALDDRYDGIYTVMDTGPKVRGRVLDIYLNSCSDARQLGRETAQVTVIRYGWDPQEIADTPANQ